MYMQYVSICAPIHVVCEYAVVYVSQGAQFNPTIMAVALPREVIEIEIPDTAGLDAVPYGDDMPDSVSMAPGNLPKRRL